MGEIMKLVPALCAAIGLGLAGCAHEIKIAVPVDQVDSFEKCLKDPSVTWRLKDAGSSSRAAGRSPSQAGPLTVSLRGIQPDASHPVGRVRQILTHPVSREVARMYNRLSGWDEAAVIDLPASSLRDFVDKVSRSTELDDWHPYSVAALESYRTATTLLHTQQLQTEFLAAENELAFAIYIRAYMQAYFRNGKFVEGKIELASLAEHPALKELSDHDRKAVEDILKKAEGKVSFGKIGDGGFVTRGGASLQFPALNVSFDAAHGKLAVTEIDHSAVGAQLIRVLFEAIFDAHDRLPAVTKATGVSLKEQHLQLAAYERIEARTGFRKVSQPAFGKIDAYANQLEGTAAAAAGRLFRGGGPLALNNEALARILETTIGITARKVAEKIGWCWFSLPEAKGTSEEAQSVPAGSAREVSIRIR
jgi:hypothetical protein